MKCCMHGKDELTADDMVMSRQTPCSVGSPTLFCRSRLDAERERKTEERERERDRPSVIYIYIYAVESKLGPRFGLF